MGFTTTLRPVSTRENTGCWNIIGGGSFVGSVSDNWDGSYLLGCGPDGEVLGFYATNNPNILASNQRCSIVRQYSRVGASSPGFSYNLDIWTRVEGRKGDGAGINVQNDSGPSTYNAAYDAEFDNGDLWALEGYFRYNGGVTTASIYDVWWDIWIQTKPSVSSVGGPSGSNNSLTPTITWANNYQGDGQNAYQVRVLQASDNAVVYDSGRVGGAATSRVVNGLTQGTSYYAQVRIASDFRGTDWWSDYSNGPTFTTLLNQSSMAGTSGMSAVGVVTSLAAATMPATGDMADTALVIVRTAISMAAITDLIATYKKSTCAACGDNCTCFLSEDGFFSGTSDFTGRNYTTVEGNGTADNPFVIHFLDQDLFRPKTAEINFQDGTITSGTTFNDPRVVTPGNSMNYESPMRFIIRDVIPNEEIFIQGNYFIIGASVTFAEIADASTTFRRIILTMQTQDPILGAREITLAGQTIPGGITDPLTLGCAGFVPGVFTNYGALSSIVSPINLYISQNSGSTLAISNVKIWVTQI